LILITAILVFVGVFWYQKTYVSLQQNACTQEAKLCPDGSYVGRTGVNCEFAICPLPIDQAFEWQKYTNAQYGFEFMYLREFATKYATMQTDPRAIVTLPGSSKVTTDGCYLQEAFAPKQSRVTINNMSFCVTESGDPGAGQLYTSYYYTTFKNGNYITLEYVVHTPNGCGAYMDTPDYQPCTDFFTKYDTIVKKPIENSVATLIFTK
jgi:hypothetical protein